MAKISGPIASAMRGKVGQVVAAKTVGGATALRSYQPVVKNPRTARQIECRQRFSIASDLAAQMANVLAIGFAKAASAAGVYPRNLFVRDMVKHGVTPISIVGGEADIEFPNVPVSKRDGIVDAATFNAVARSTSGTIKVTANSVPTGDNLTDGRMGVVIAAYNEDGKVCIVSQDVASSLSGAGVEINVGAAYVGMEFHVYGFFKWIPNAMTDISTTDTPWKFPSATSGSHYAGKVTIS